MSVTSDQHVECSGARMHADISDTKHIVHYLGPLEPFYANPKLRNIVTGVASGNVNINPVTDTRMKLLHEMIDKT